MIACACQKKEYHNAHFLVTKPASGWPNAFAIITAYNPKGTKKATAEENLIAHEKLRRELTEHESFDAIGCSPDLKHQEPGYAVVLASIEEAIHCGQCHHQDAIFWIEQDSLILICCNCPTRLPIGSWEERIVGES